jgi:penicillin G amidase
VIPGGQSGHPASAHYDDQLDAWLEGRLLPMAFDRSAVESRAVTRLRLEPAR